MDRRSTRWYRQPSLKLRAWSSVVPPAAVTLLALPEGHPPTAVMALLYVLGVVIAARVGGAWAGVCASALSFLTLNFFFTEPLHTFVVGAAEDWVSLLVFLITSVVIGVLLSSALGSKASAEQRELEARLVNHLAARLLAGEPTEKTLEGFADGLCALFDLRGCEITTSFSPSALAQKGDLVGEAEVIPLRGKNQNLGEMRLWLGGEPSLDDDERRAIRSLATQLALALEGVRLSVEVRRAELDAQASDLKAALFSGVTHDVKTPLAAITASVTSLIEGSDFSEDARQEHLETIRQEADRLHRVVNNLLDVARMRAGVLVAIKSPSPIDELMESVLNRLRPILDGRPVDIRVGEDVPEIAMDVVQIDQVLTNLVENAVKFTAPGSPIALTAVGGTDVVRITVADQGPGIPKDQRGRIFEPFERGTGKGAGTGLGLAICDAIVNAHGGRMWVTDSPRGGAAFTFELPCPPMEPEEVTDVRADSHR